MNTAVSQDLLSRIRVVLVGTTHPGNIGSAARAMKTMGLSDLVLVGPRHFPHDDATAMASGADDLLDAIRVYDALPDAIADCSLAIGASARLRSTEVPPRPPRAIAQALAKDLPATLAADNDASVAFVFGREKSGLTNAELDHCRWLLHVPTNPDYMSLNLAMAVQVVAYELRLAFTGGEIAAAESAAPPATQAAVENLFEHLEQTLIDVEFLDPDNPRLLMRRLRRLLHRAEPDADEVNILRGILTAMQKQLG